MNEDILYQQYLSNNTESPISIEEFTSLKSIMSPEDFDNFVGLKKKENSQETPSSSSGLGENQPTPISAQGNPQITSVPISQDLDLNQSQIEAMQGVQNPASLNLELPQQSVNQNGLLESNGEVNTSSSVLEDSFNNFIQEGGKLPLNPTSTRLNVLPIAYENQFNNVTQTTPQEEVGNISLPKKSRIELATFETNGLQEIPIPNKSISDELGNVVAKINNDVVKAYKTPSGQTILQTGVGLIPEEVYLSLKDKEGKQRTPQSKDVYENINGVFVEQDYSEVPIDETIKSYKNYDYISSKDEDGSLLVKIDTDTEKNLYLGLQAKGLGTLEFHEDGTPKFKINKDTAYILDSILLSDKNDGISTRNAIRNSAYISSVYEGAELEKNARENFISRYGQANYDKYGVLPPQVMDRLQYEERLQNYVSQGYTEQEAVQYANNYRKIELQGVKEENNFILNNIFSKLKSEDSQEKKAWSAFAENYPKEFRDFFNEYTEKFGDEAWDNSYLLKRFDNPMRRASIKDEFINYLKTLQVYSQIELKNKEKQAKADVRFGAENKNADLINQGYAKLNNLNMVSKFIQGENNAIATLEDQTKPLFKQAYEKGIENADLESSANRDEFLGVLELGAKKIGNFPFKVIGNLFQSATSFFTGNSDWSKYVNEDIEFNKNAFELNKNAEELRTEVITYKDKQGNIYKLRDGNIYKVDKNGYEFYKPELDNNAFKSNLTEVSRDKEWNITSVTAQGAQLIAEVYLMNRLGTSSGNLMSKPFGSYAVRIAKELGTESRYYNILKSAYKGIRASENASPFGMAAYTFGSMTKRNNDLGYDGLESWFKGMFDAGMMYAANRFFPDARFFKEGDKVQKTAFNLLKNGDKKGALELTKNFFIDASYYTKNSLPDIGGEMFQEMGLERMFQGVSDVVSGAFKQDKKIWEKAIDPNNFVDLSPETALLTALSTGTIKGVQNLKTSPLASFEGMTDLEKVILSTNMEGLQDALRFISSDASFAGFTGSKATRRLLEMQTAKKYLDQLPKDNTLTLSQTADVITNLQKLENLKKEQEKATSEAVKKQYQEQINTLEEAIAKKFEESKNNTIIDEQPQQTTQPKQTQKTTQGQTTETNVQPEQGAVTTEQGVSADVEAKKTDIERRRQEELDNNASRIIQKREIWVDDEGRRFAINHGKNGRQILYGVDENNKNQGKIEEYEQGVEPSKFLDNPTKESEQTGEEYYNSLNSKNKTLEQKINAKYDAELKELKNNNKTLPTNETEQTTKPQQSNVGNTQTPEIIGNQTDETAISEEEQEKINLERLNAYIEAKKQREQEQKVQLSPSAEMGNVQQNEAFSINEQPQTIEQPSETQTTTLVSESKSTNGKYTIRVEQNNGIGTAKILDNNGNEVKLTNKQKEKYVAEHFAKQSYPETVVEDGDKLKPSEFNREIIKTSNNPLELAQILDTESEFIPSDLLDAKENAIANVIGKKVSRSSFIQFDDANNISFSIARGYGLTNKGKTIDVIAQEAEVLIYGDWDSQNPRVTTEDVINFMKTYNNGADTFFRQPNPTYRDAAGKFEKITGIKATKNALDVLLGKKTATKIDFAKLQKEADVLSAEQAYNLEKEYNEWFNSLSLEDKNLELQKTYPYEQRTEEDTNQSQNESVSNNQTESSENVANQERNGATTEEINKPLQGETEGDFDYKDKSYFWTLQKKKDNSINTFYIKFLPSVGSSIREKLLAKIKNKIESKYGKTVYVNGNTITINDSNKVAYISKEIQETFSNDRIGIEKSKEAQAKKTKQNEDTDSLYKQKFDEQKNAYNFITEYFGDDFANNFNKLALINYITGNASSFKGLVNKKWIEGFSKLDALIKDGRDVDWRKVKKSYEKYNEEKGNYKAEEINQVSPSPQYEGTVTYTQFGEPQKGNIYYENGVAKIKDKAGKVYNANSPLVKNLKDAEGNAIQLQKGNERLTPITKQAFDALVKKLQKAFPRFAKVTYDFEAFKKQAEKLGYSANDIQNHINDEQDDIYNLEKNLLEKYKELKTLFLSKKNKTISIDMIEVEKTSRNEGVGTSIMNEIVSFADENGYEIELVPALKDDNIGTTSRKRLVSFYKRFGFVENKGRNKDFARRSGGMYRLNDIQFMQTPNGTIYGAKLPDGTIYLNPEFLNANTPIHEFSHLFEQLLPSRFKKGVELLKQTNLGKKLFEQLKQEGNYANLTDEQLWSEALNTHIGNFGENEVNNTKGKLKQLQDWIKDFFAKVGDVLGIKKLSPDTQLRMFTEGVVKDLLGGKPIVAENQVSPSEQVQYSLNENDIKLKQLEIINKTNPAPNSYNTWIRTVNDIKTPEEAFRSAFEDGAMYPDFTLEDMQKVLETGKVTVYSSYPIKEGVFVSPSKMNAEEYAGGRGKKVYSKEIDAKDLAWIDESEGQYAPVNSSEVLAEIQAEREAIKAEAQANGTFMKAPNGKSTNLNEAQWIDVRTKRFKDWFGDWENDAKNASKVVDENGEPLVVFRNDNVDFNIFDKKKQKDGLFGKGFFFTSDKSRANNYGNISKSFFINGNVTFIGDDIIKTTEPNQIKSATANLGTYSANTNDIRYSINSTTPLSVKEQTEVINELVSNGEESAFAKLQETNWYKGLSNSQKQNINTSNIAETVINAVNSTKRNLEQKVERRDAKIEKLQQEKDKVVKSLKDKIKELKSEYKDKIAELNASNKSFKEKFAEKVFWKRQAVNAIKLILKDKYIRKNVTDNDIIRLLNLSDRIFRDKDVNVAFENFEKYLDKVMSKEDAKEKRDKEKYDKIYNEVEEQFNNGVSLSEIVKSYEKDTDKERAKKAYYEIQGKSVTPEQAVEMMEKINKAEEEMLNPKKSFKDRLKTIRQGFNQKLLDRQWLPKQLLERAGAMDTFNRLINFGGASSKAKMLFDRAYRKIWFGLGIEDIKILNNIIQNKRVISIAENRAKRGLDPINNTVSEITINAQGKNVVVKQMMTKDTAQAYLDGVKAKIGEKKFNKLSQRAEAYFAEFKNLLDALLDNGMIRQESYDIMVEIDYQPRVFLEHLLDYDQKLSKEEQEFRNKTNGLTKDLIKQLENGSEGALLSNSQLLLASAINSRVQAIAMNDINKQFITKDFPKARIKFEAIDPKNFKNAEERRFYKYFKELDAKVIIPDGNTIDAKQGYSKAYYFENGVRKEFLLEDELHGLWHDKVRGLNPDMKQKLSYATGSSLLKGMATGYNPAFIIVNTPRDFLHTLSFSPEYRGVALWEGALLATDFAKATAPFVGSIYKFNKGKDNVVRKYFEYGGGMDFLNQQGIAERDNVIRGTYQRLLKYLPQVVQDEMSADAVGKFLSTIALRPLSNYSELGFRIANFTRALENQLSDYNKDNKTKYKSINEIPDKEIVDNIYHYAVSSTRGLLDFNQGGTFVKDAESVLPYINAGVQGTRAAVQAFRKDPIGVSTQIAQIVTMTSVTFFGIGLYFIGAIRPDDEDEDKETLINNYLDFRESLTPEQKKNYFALPVGYNKADNSYEVLLVAKSQPLTPLFVLSEEISENILKRQVGKEEKSMNDIIASMGRAFSDNIDPTSLSTLFTGKGKTFADNVKTTAGKLASRNPAFKGVATALSGYDFYFNQPLQDTESGKLSKFEGQSSNRVEQFYKDFGLASNFSPVRTKAFIESIVTSPTTNPFVGMFYAGSDAIFTDVTVKEAIKDFLGYNKQKEKWMFRETPVINRAIKETSDFSRQLNQAENIKADDEYVKALEETEYMRMKSDEIISEYLDKARNAQYQDEADDFVKQGLEEALIYAKDKYKDDPVRGKQFMDRAITKLQNYDTDGRVWDIKYSAENNPEAQAFLIYSYFGDIMQNEDSERIIRSLKAAGLTSNSVMSYYQKIIDKNKK